MSKEFEKLEKVRDRLFNKITKGWEISHLKDLNKLINIEIELENYCND